MASPTAQDLYERYERNHDLAGVTVRTWTELSDREHCAWKSIADYVYVVMHPFTKPVGRPRTRAHDPANPKCPCVDCRKMRKEAHARNVNDAMSADLG